MARLYLYQNTFLHLKIPEGEDKNVLPPKESNVAAGHVQKLKKALYGVPEAPTLSVIVFGASVCLQSGFQDC